ncbi:uncharacterized protein LTR77_006859 [Saxophila tyrrhenica]|uniref:Uncharacterized protein n=1 Tax=Saxophila tyrrhenica TaxID=1690608 RepID=A0AAV9P5U2_9PEZI|nr:hypothetical protein LTR77_006859 [Saxophila tyrrhenica]
MGHRSSASGTGSIHDKESKKCFCNKEMRPSHPTRRGGARSHGSALLSRITLADMAKTKQSGRPKKAASKPPPATRQALTPTVPAKKAATTKSAAPAKKAASSGNALTMDKLNKLGKIRKEEPDSEEKKNRADRAERRKADAERTAARGANAAQGTGKTAAPSKATKAAKRRATKKPTTKGGKAKAAKVTKQKSPPPSRPSTYKNAEKYRKTVQKLISQMEADGDGDYSDVVETLHEVVTRSLNGIITRRNNDVESDSSPRKPGRRTRANAAADEEDKVKDEDVKNEDVKDEEDDE